MKRIFILLVLLLFSYQIFAGRMADEWKLIINKNYDAVISKLKDKPGKTAEAYYLLGKAYYEKGNNIKAAEAWKETLRMTKNNKSKKKWDFLWPPKSLRTKKLTAQKKKKVYEKFKAQFEEVKGAAQSELKNSAKANSRKADKKRIDAERKKAEAKKATAKANAKSEAINDKHKVADRKLKSAQTKAEMAKNRRLTNKNMPVRVKKKPAGKGSFLGFIIILIIIAIFIFVIVKGKPARNSGGGRGFERRRYGRYDIYYNDDIFNLGPFWYDGIYFRNEAEFYDRFGYHFTNRMFADSYDQYADKYEQEAMHDLHEVDRMNDEIINDVDEREKLRNQAADANYEADMLESDAKELENEARYNNEDYAEYNEASDAFDEEPQFDDSDDDDDDDDW